MKYVPLEDLLQEQEIETEESILIRFQPKDPISSAKGMLKNSSFTTERYMAEKESERALEQASKSL